MRAAASITCSQLSSTSISCFLSSAFATRSADMAPAASSSPSAVATVTGTSSGSEERREFDDPGSIGKFRQKTPRNEALTRSERTEARWCIAELLRIKGVLVLHEGGPNSAEVAEGHFLKALDWARRQGALSWELRTATSLSRLWHDQGRTQEAHRLLAPIYDRFTEGFATIDLRAAKALIADISPTTPPFSVAGHTRHRERKHF